jgi:hypothetical protein
MRSIKQATATTRRRKAADQLLFFIIISNIIDPESSDCDQTIFDNHVESPYPCAIASTSKLVPVVKNFHFCEAIKEDGPYPDHQLASFSIRL